MTSIGAMWSMRYDPSVTSCPILSRTPRQDTPSHIERLNLGRSGWTRELRVGQPGSWPGLMPFDMLECEAALPHTAAGVQHVLPLGNDHQINVWVSCNAVG